MLLPFIIYPSTLKALLLSTTPWLIGGGALGILAGRQSHEQTQHHEHLTRQQAEIKQQTVINADLMARLERNKVTPTSIKSRVKKQDENHDFLKHILEANLKLRENTEHSTGEPLRG
jgi:acid stress-induced BolA-like protein IbaG/YrbA